MSIDENQLIMAEIPIVRFQIEDVNFGLDVYQIRDIIKLEDVFRVPNSPEYITGVINLRGQIIPVVNLRKRLSFDDTHYGENVRILIVEFGDDLSGLIVDSVSEVTLISSANIEPRPRYLVNNIDANFLIGLALNKVENIAEERANLKKNIKRKESDFILLLDIAKVLNLAEKQKEKSIIKRIIERKTKLLSEEREKLKQQIIQLKNQQKGEILSSLQTNLISRGAESKKKVDDSFKERQNDLIQKIKASQDATLQINLGTGKDVKSLPSKSKNISSEKLIKIDEASFGKSKDMASDKKKVKRVVVRKKSDETDIVPNKDQNNLMGKINLEQKVLTREDVMRNTTFDDLDEMQLSLIQEIGNIGAGNAATALSTMIDKRVDISVPRVKVVPTEILSESLGGSEILAIAIYLAVEGDVSMYMMLIFKKASGLRLSDLLLFQERPEEELNSNEPLGQMDESALMEVGNILGSHYLTALSEFTGLHMIPGPPSLAYDMLGSVIDFIQIELEEKVDTALILNTDIIVEERKIEGYILILPIPESITSMLSEMGL